MWDQGKRESHKQIYTDSLLHQELHPVPRNHWVVHYAIKTRLQTPHTKVVTLNPSRNTLPLANHTKSIDLEHLKNTKHSLATQLQKYRRLRKDYTWSKHNWKVYNCNPIPLSLENSNLENLISNLPN